MSLNKWERKNIACVGGWGGVCVCMCPDQNAVSGLITFVWWVGEGGGFVVCVCVVVDVGICVGWGTGAKN